MISMISNDINAQLSFPPEESETYAVSADSILGKNMANTDYQNIVWHKGEEYVLTGFKCHSEGIRI